MATSASNSDRGGVLIITDPPPSFDFGIDCMHYETGPDFRGVCMIPPGLHFIYYSTGSTASRQGFFLIYEKGDIVVKSWDRSTEDIAYSPLLPDETLEALHRAVHQGRMDKQLGPYPLSDLKSWHNLSSFITGETLRLGGALPHTPLFPGDAEDLPSALNKLGAQQEVQPYFPDAARIAKFCNIKEMEVVVRNAILQSMDGACQITAFYMDRSQLLEYVIDNYFSGHWEGILGELQLSFILFMLLFSYPALQQWKVLVDLLCRCERVLLQHQDFTAAFVRILYHQLQYSPSDFFETEISTDNFLRPAVSNLFEVLSSPSSGLGENLKEHRDRLLIFMEKKFGLYETTPNRDCVNDTSNKYSYQMDRYNLVDEDLPVVVDMYDESSKKVQRQESSQSDRESWTVDGGASTTHQMHQSALEAAIDQVVPSWGAAVTSSGDMLTEMERSRMQPDSTTEMVTEGTSGRETDDKMDSTYMQVRHQEDKFSWRYPALFEAMVSHNSKIEGVGKEDLAMTAVRLLDEGGCSGAISTEWGSAYGEATRFIEEEMSKWTAS